MDLSTITVQDFKDEFMRSFPYLSALSWVSTKNYPVGSEVYLESNKTFYKAKTSNIDKSPEISAGDWEVFLDSEFNYINDSDIEKAYRESQAVFNQALFSPESTLTLAYKYLTAHYLSLDLKASMQGINANAPTTVASKSVGSVSESYSVPKAWTEDPNIQFYTTTYYGVKYLSIVMPLLIGNIQVIQGATTP